MRRIGIFEICPSEVVCERATGILKISESILSTSLYNVIERYETRLHGYLVRRWNEILKAILPQT